MATAEQIRAALEETLGTKLNPKLWRLMLDWEKHDGALAEEPGEYSFMAEIESLAGAYRDLAGLVGSPENLKRRDARVVPSDKRLQALAEILALDAGRLPSIADFRRQHLADGLLDEESVGSWVRSRACDLDKNVAYASVPLPAGFGPPPKDAPLADWLEELATALRTETAGATPAPLQTHHEYLQFRAGDEYHPDMGLYGGEIDEVFDPNPQVQRVPVSPGTELWELRALSRGLALRNGWAEATATNFILTGAAPPPVKAVAWTRHRVPFAALTRIVIEADPRIAPAEVRRLYGTLRRELRGGGDQQMTDKHIELALFIARDGSRLPASLGLELEGESHRDRGRRGRLRMRAMAPDMTGQGTTWPELQKRWNRAHPEWAYGDARARQFSRDVRTAWKRVTGQPWWAPAPAEDET